MTIASNQPLPRTHSTQKSVESSNAKHISKEKFEEMLRVSEIDERPKEDGLFSLIEEEELKKEISEKDAALAAASASMHSFFDNVTHCIAQANAVMTIDVEALFEKMAAAMIVQESTRERETTLWIENTSSQFYGAKITIREFSIAPKIFNIEIAGSPTAIQALEAHKAELMKAFKEKNFNFSVHRLDTEISNENPDSVFQRKDFQENDEGDQTR